MKYAYPKKEIFFCVNLLTNLYKKGIVILISNDYYFIQKVNTQRRIEYFKFQKLI